MTSPSVAGPPLESFDNPYPFYRWLRENDPVHFDKDRDGWLVTRYEDVAALLRDDDRLTAEQDGPDSTSMLVSDPPKHTRLRGLVSAAFTPRRVRELRPRIQEIVDGLLDDLAGRDEAEIISEFAYPLPITVIAEMMGVDHDRRDFFRSCSNRIAMAMGPSPDALSRKKAGEGSRELRAYFDDLIERRRSDPGDDLVTACIQAEQEGDKLNHPELLGLLNILLIGGHETTVNLVGNGLAALLQHPDQLRRLQAEPVERTATDELLRFDSPVQYTGRIARKQFELHGRTIRPGERVRLMLGSANRDPATFKDPDTLDVARHPCPHLSFGAGIHFCLGAELARIEGEIALSTIVRRFPGMRLATETLQWRPAHVLRGLETLPVRL